MRAAAGEQHTFAPPPPLSLQCRSLPAAARSLPVPVLPLHLVIASDDSFVPLCSSSRCGNRDGWLGGRRAARPTAERRSCGSTAGNAANRPAARVWQLHGRLHCTLWRRRSQRRGRAAGTLLEWAGGGLLPTAAQTSTSALVAEPGRQDSDPSRRNMPGKASKRYIMHQNIAQRAVLATNCHLRLFRSDSYAAALQAGGDSCRQLPSQIVRSRALPAVNDSNILYERFGKEFREKAMQEGRSCKMHIWRTGSESS